jgi:hypothetical protein
MATDITESSNTSGRSSRETIKLLHMSPESRRLAGILLVVLPTVIIGGVSILSLLISDPAYAEND